jgi:ABC-2 type transport system ATP-binding protein
VLDMPMDEIPVQYAQLIAAPAQADAARALKPLTERQLLGRHVFLYEGADQDALAGLGEVHQPSIADLFVAKMSGGAA